MQKSILLISSLFCLVVMNFVLSSCNDSEPFVKPILSMADAAKSISEAGGTVSVVFELDKAYSSGITVEYTLSGTATEGSAADYTVAGATGEVEIASGSTSGTLQITINNDQLFEGNETIVVRIKDVDSEDIEISTDDETEVTITDDDSKAKLSFASATLVTDETDRAIMVQLQLDKAVPLDVVATFELSGDATDSVDAASNEQLAGDYQVQVVEQGKITIPANQTTATIKIKSYSDFRLEDDETIVITLLSGGSQVDIGTIGSITITLNQEDGKVIVLFWDEAYTTVDMDMFMWIGNPGTPVGELDLFAASAFAGFEPPEALIVPYVILDAAFGMSYTYYEGDEDPMDFEVQFIDFADGVFEPAGSREVYTASYTLANINPWDQVGGSAPLVVQTFDVDDGVFSTPTAITVPGSGSRIATPKFDATAFSRTTSASPLRLRGIQPGKLNK